MPAIANRPASSPDTLAPAANAPRAKIAIDPKAQAESSTNAMPAVDGCLMS
ncbi:MAG: hypothetical protein IPJ28_10675 [Betaproteobacteria bacterium]|nr:hypothetical protein [Betaproteobacteria bacterium]